MKRGDQAFISISTILKFSSQVCISHPVDEKYIVLSIVQWYLGTSWIEGWILDSSLTLNSPMNMRHIVHY